MDRLLYRQNRSRSTGRFSALVFVLAALVLAALAGLVYTAYRVLLAPRPQIALTTPFKVVGRQAPLELEVKEPKYGLRSVKVALRQGSNEWVLHEEAYTEPRPGVKVSWTPAGEKRFRLAEGDGSLHVEAKSASFAGLGGKSAELDHAFTARLVPPRLEVLTTQHYVNQGGCDMIVYKVTPPAAESGIAVGSYYFKGFPLPGASDPAVHFAIFAVPYDVEPSTPVRLKAKDEAGNEALTGFWIKVFPKTFRSRDIELDDGFLNKVVPEIMSQTPSLADKGDLLQNYLQINRDLRKENNRALTELAAKSPQEFLWTQPFRQLTNSQVEASFADHRTYRYQGKEVDRQDHLGYDLATVSQAPVEASNDGKVAKAEFFGIYGNTVVIDHGYGLLSLYGHLSSFGLKPGEGVTRGQPVGRSGATGLAGGDHLHYSMILQGAQVDAREWWDPHWIQDRIAAKLKQFGSAAGPAAGGAAEAAKPKR